MNYFKGANVYIQTEREISPKWYELSPCNSLDILMHQHKNEAADKQMYYCYDYIDKLTGDIYIGDYRFNYVKLQLMVNAIRTSDTTGAFIRVGNDHLVARVNRSIAVMKGRKEC